MSHSTSNATYPRTAIPGPRGYPIVGVLPNMARDLLGFLVSVSNQYDGLVRLRVGPRSMHLITHPDAVKHILQDNYRNYIKGYDAVERLLGQGLVTSEGELWRRQRRLMQPAFHQRRVATLLDSMARQTTAMLTRWQAAARDRQQLDLADEFMGLTRRIIVATMFSTDIGDQAEAVGHAFATTMEYLGRHVFNPLPLPEWLPTPATRRYQQALRLLDTVVYRIVAERRASSRSANDLLSMLIDAQDAETGEQMTPKQVRDEVMTIFLAGHETTATVLAWACYTLAQHPPVEHRLREELASVLGGRTPELADLPKLSYTRMVIDEVLRLYPPAWMFARRALADDELGGYHLPAGAMVAISPYVTHRNPDFWESPEHFDPERFEEARQAGRPRFAYHPFSGGPRVCIGNSFALMEAQLILAMLYQGFELALVPGRTVRPRPGSTLRPQPGVWMTIQKC